MQIELQFFDCRNNLYTGHTDIAQHELGALINLPEKLLDEDKRRYIPVMFLIIYDKLTIFKYKLLLLYGRECQCLSDQEAMLWVTESLTEEPDFVRVDLYSLGNEIYFGELTPYPGGVAGITYLRGVDGMLGLHTWEKMEEEIKVECLDL